MRCILCPHACNVDRSKGVRGYCGASDQIEISRAALHLWEEPCLSGNNGAGAVFFTHCTLGCVYCQNHEISGNSAHGKIVSVLELANIFLHLQKQGAHNLDLVTPSHYAPQIVQALQLAKKQGLKIPIVYNCGGYESLETLRMLDGLIDIWMPDFKYYSSYYAARYSNAPDYLETASAAITEMLGQVGTPQYNEDGLLTRGVLIRHLMLPSLSGDTAQILRHIAEHFGDRVLVSLMRQFTPMNLSNYPEINRTITDAEYAEAMELFLSLGLSGFSQDSQAISESFIPKWDVSSLSLHF